MKDQKFKDLLDQNYAWPTLYKFQFIVLTQNIGIFIEEVKAHGLDLEFRASKNDKYTSIRFSLMADSSEMVMDLYRRAARVPGIISL